MATWCKELTHLKRPWCRERLKAGGEADDRGWDGWMASPTQWMWVWVGSRSWWWTGKPDMLQSTGLQRVRHDWVTELNWTDLHSRPGWVFYLCAKPHNLAHSCNCPDNHTSWAFPISLMKKEGKTNLKSLQNHYPKHTVPLLSYSKFPEKYLYSLTPIFPSSF